MQLTFDTTYTSETEQLTEAAAKAYREKAQAAAAETHRNAIARGDDCVICALCEIIRVTPLCKGETNERLIVA